MIAFPCVDRPDVSIVMVTYGGWEWVSRALGAIVANTEPCYEMVVVDNASPDDTGDALDRSVLGATIVRNDRNVGFGPGANQGALHAVGRYLLFLNSDAFVEPGWLPPLRDVLDRDPRVGAVAPRLLEPDGTLQEAGGLVGAGGFAGQFGMGADANDARYRYRRRVDFASAAALLVRRRDFRAVGGFDPAYGMGYFEDVDLCLDLWGRGLATVYEPASTVVHLRGASTTFDESQARAARSHPVFLRKWARQLAMRSPVAELERYPHRLVASRDARAPDRILVVRTGRGPRAPIDELASRWPDALITVLHLDDPDAAGDGRLLGLGVEVASTEDGLGAWLAERRFHYSVVVVEDEGAGTLYDGMLGRYQPQAVRSVATPAALDRAMAEAGFAPPLTRAAQPGGVRP